MPSNIDILHSDNYVDEDADDSDQPEAQAQGQVQADAGVGPEGQIWQSGRHRPEQSYGFALSHLTTLDHLAELVTDINPAQPQRMSHIQRRWLRIQQEQADFSAERYLADYYYAREEDPIYQMFMDHRPYWEGYFHAWAACRASGTASETDKQAMADQLLAEHEPMQLTEDEQTDLQEIQRKYSRQPSSSTPCVCPLVDILLCYLYEHCLTDGEHNCESAENITRLSSALSWLDPLVFSSDCIPGPAAPLAQPALIPVVLCFMRRLAIYPYLRVLGMGAKLLTHLAQLLACGRQAVLKVLLSLRELLMRDSSGASKRGFYLLNTLFIDQYIHFFLDHPAGAGMLDALATDLKALSQLLYPTTATAGSGQEEHQLADWAKRALGLHIDELEELPGMDRPEGPIIPEYDMLALLEETADARQELAYLREAKRLYEEEQSNNSTVVPEQVEEEADRGVDLVAERLALEGLAALPTPPSSHTAGQVPEQGSFLMKAVSSRRITQEDRQQQQEGGADAAGTGTGSEKKLVEELNKLDIGGVEENESH